MPRKEQLSGNQLTNLVIIFLLGTSVITGSRVLVSAGRSAWAALLLAAAGAVPLILILGALQKRFPGKNIAEYSEIILGKFLGKFLNLVYLIYLLLLLVLISDNLSLIYTALFYIRTPTWFFDLTLYLLCFLGAWGGLNCIGSLAEIASPLIGLVIILTSILAFISPTAEFNRLFPMLTEGLKPILQAAWFTFAFPFGEIVVLATFFSAVEKGKSIVMPFLKGLVAGTAIYLFTAVRNLVVLGPEVLGLQSFPSATVVRMIQVGGFIERVEAFIVIFWVLSIFMKAVIVFYASSLFAVQIFPVKNKMLFWPLIILIAFLVDVYLINTQFLINYINENIYPYMVVLQIFAPAFLLLVAQFRGLKAKERGTNSA